MQHILSAKYCAVLFPDPPRLSQKVLKIFAINMPCTIPKCVFPKMCAVRTLLGGDILYRFAIIGKEFEGWGAQPNRKKPALCPWYFSGFDLVVADIERMKYTALLLTVIFSTGEKPPNSVYGVSPFFSLWHFLVLLSCTCSLKVLERSGFITVSGICAVWSAVWREHWNMWPMVCATPGARLGTEPSPIGSRGHNIACFLHWLVALLM